MAALSSEVGTLNIGIAETSSHPKNNYEIEVVETVRDFNDKTKNSKQPTSKSTNKGFKEATVDSKWYHALRDNDCNALVSLLKADSCLVAQTGPKGRTVLHAAAHRGCLQLLNQVLELFKDNDEFVNKKFGVKVDFVDFLTAKCRPFKAEAQNIAWFTFPRHDWIRMHPRRLTSETIHPRDTKSSSGASQDVRVKLVEIMQGEPSKDWTKDLKTGYESDANYNFVLDRKELQFHYACEVMLAQKEMKPLPIRTAMLYVKAVIAACQNSPESHKVLTYLFELHNAQGQTPVHVASGNGKHGNINQLLTIMRSIKHWGNVYKECLNARDVKGWTILHYFVATKNHDGLEELLKDNSLVDINARTAISKDKQVDGKAQTTISKAYLQEAGMTALHLAILHNDVESVELLLQVSDINVIALLYRRIVCGYERNTVGDDYDNFGENTFWSPLQLAAIMGLSNIVRALLGSSQKQKIYDDEKLQSNTIDKEKELPRVPSLLLASASGNPDTLQLFLDDPKFDPLVTFNEATALHYATHAMIPRAKKDKELFESYKVDKFLYFSDLGYLDRNACKYKEESKDMKMTKPSYLGRQACITMLLQVGVDIWGKDTRGRFAGPGAQAPIEAQLWWHGKIAQETLEAENSLNNAANAISVVAALVATASYVGPLQPPLGYGGDSMSEGGVQDTHLSIRVFMVSSNLSFYFAIASIMFAVVPSLPMPQEGIYSEWQRKRRLRTFGLAIFFLLMSILSVLISFGAASNSVVLEDYSWRHDGLVFYPTLVGGFICILGISLFFLRLLRLVFNSNAKIRSLYNAFVKF